MNHTVLVKTAIRALVVCAFAAHFTSYAMIGYPSILHIDSDDQTELIDTNCQDELHPIFLPAFNAVLHSNQGNTHTLQKVFENASTTWSLGEQYRYNNACGSACIAALHDNHVEAMKLFEDAADQGSFWGAHSAGLYHLLDFNMATASDYFKLALKNQSNQAHVPSYRHFMALVGFPATEEHKFNMLALIDKFIIRSSGKRIDCLAYPLSFCAANNGDVVTQEICLHEAIKHNNAFRPLALADLEKIEQARKKEQEMISRALENKPTNASETLPAPHEVIAHEVVTPEVITHEVAQIEKTPIMPVIPTVVASPVPSEVDKPALVINAQLDSPVVVKKQTKLDEAQALSEHCDTALDEQLRKANGVLLQALKRETQEAKITELQQNLRAIDNERLKRTKNPSERIGLLNEMVNNYQDSAAQLELGVHHYDKGQQKRGWNLLQASLKQHNIGAYVALIERGFKSDEAAKQIEAAQHLDRLLLIKEVSLDNACKGALCAAGGLYASKIDKKRAYALFQEADACGNHEHAYIYGRLAFEDGNYAEAERQFGLVTGVHVAQARLYDSAVKMVNNADLAALSTLIEPVIEGSGFVMQEALVKDIFSNVRLQAALAECDKDPRALMILAYCKAKGWGMAGRQEADPLLAYEYYKQVLAIPSLDESLKAQCVRSLRALGQKGCDEARAHVMRHYPDEEEQKVTALYSKINTVNIIDIAHCMADVSPAVIERNAASADKTISSQAHYCLGVYSLNWGAQYIIDTKFVEAQHELGKAVMYFQNAQEKGIEAAGAWISRVWYLMAQTFKENDSNRYAALKKAADDKKNPHPAACVGLYYYHTSKGQPDVAEEYLQKARALKQVRASIIYLEREFEQVKAASGSRDAIHAKINALLEESDSKIIEIAPLYSLKAACCDDIDEAMTWHRKAVKLNDSPWATRVAMYDIEKGNYADAAETLSHIRTTDPYKEQHSLLDAFVNYKLLSNDTKKRTNALQHCALSLILSLKNQADETVQSWYPLLINGLDLPAEGGNEDEERVQMLWAYLQKDYQKAYNLARKLEKKSDRSACSLMFEFYMHGHGVCQQDDSKAFAYALIALNNETNMKSHYVGREQLAQILRKNQSMRMKPEDEISKTLINIYETITSNKGPSEELDNYLVGQLQDYLAQICVERSDAAQLLKWYKTMPASHQSKLEYEGWLHFYKMLDKKDTASATQAGIAAWKKYAQTGPVSAQQILLMLYDYGIELPNGVHVEQDYKQAMVYADRIIENPNADKAQKAHAHSFLAREALHAYVTAPSNDESRKDSYKACVRNAQEALTQGSYEAIGYQIALYLKAGEDDFARDLYTQHVGNEKLWKDNRGVLMLSLAVIGQDFCNLKQIVEQLSKVYAADTMVIGQLTDARESSTTLECLINAKYGLARKNPVEHGFKDQAELDTLCRHLLKRIAMYNRTHDSTRALNRTIPAQTLANAQKTVKTKKPALVSEALQDKVAFIATILTHDSKMSDAKVPARAPEASSPAPSSPSTSMIAVLDTISEERYLDAQNLLKGSVPQDDPYREHSLLAKAYVAYKQSPDDKKRSDLLQWYNYSLRKMVDKPGDAKIAAFHEKIFQSLDMPDENEAHEEVEIKLLRAKIAKDLDLMCLFAGDLVGRACATENVEQALRWYKEIPEERLQDRSVCALRAWFAARNAFKKNPAQARKDYIAFLEEAADKGHPLAQIEQIENYSNGVEFSFGGKIEPDLGKALFTALNLIANKDVSEQQKYTGYKLLISQEELMLQKATKVSEKRDHFRSAHLYYSRLIKAGFYNELPNYVKLGFAMKDIECEGSDESIGFRHVNQLCQSNWNNDVIWKNNALMMPLCAEIVHVNPGYMKQLIFEKLLPNFNKQQIFGLSTNEVVACIESLNYLKYILSLNLDPALYGFENAEQKAIALLEVETLINNIPATFSSREGALGRIEQAHEILKGLRSALGIRKK